MNTGQIWSIFRALISRHVIPQHHHHTLKQVAAYNELVSPDFLNKNKLLNPNASGYILNTASSEETGEHWLAVYQPNKVSLLEVFDSYGQRLSFWNRQIEAKILTFSHIKMYLKSSIMLQDLRSNVCGFYTIAFLVYRMQGKTFQEFLNDFNVGIRTQNDQHVKDYIMQQTGCCWVLPTHCPLREQSCKSLWHSLSQHDRPYDNSTKQLSNEDGCSSC
jgi:hypothetical protein